ncbi:putative exosortase interaction domain-containing protein [Methyloglobulus morosus KoM1]|uniref:Putative exosortase interaction domain-containing protein n=2 Tax=Methyloglobulus TaxID=1410680 RepID=V5DV54_9GAMM|nr:putative exosortase interaction domain-containing protein [Methyloglobulus morosus KoM1]
MKIDMKRLFLVATLFTCKSLSAAIVLDFEGVGDQASINDFYNGGKSSSGASGQNYGIHFSNDATGLIDSNVDFKYSGNFANEPSASTVAVFRNGGVATMNVASGFDTGFSFFYSYSSHESASADIYGGQNGTGELLGSLHLSTNFDQGCTNNPSGYYCHWNPIGLQFKGIAKSVVFGGPPEYALFDNLTLGSATPSKVPIVGAFWFMGPCLLALLSMGRRIRH